MLSELSVYDPKYSAELEGLSEEEREDWLEEETALRNGFSNLMIAMETDSVAGQSLDEIESAIEAYRTLDTFAVDFRECKQVGIEEARSDFVRQEKNSKEYWDAYGRLKFLLRNVTSINKDSITEIGRLVAEAQANVQSVKKLDVFDELTFPQSFAIVYKMCGESHLDGWIGKVITGDVSKKGVCHAYECFADVLCPTSLQDCFSRWVVDHEIVRYVGEQYQSIQECLLDVFDRFASDRLFLFYLDTVSTMIFNTLTSGNSADTLVSRARSVLRGSNYESEFERVYVEITRRCKQLVCT